MMGMQFVTILRKWAAGLAVLALLLSTSAPMGVVGSGGTCSEICCDLSLSDLDGKQPVGHPDHQCQLCLLHCHLGWAAPIAGGNLGAVDLTSIDGPIDAAANFVFSPFGDFNPAIPRAPPVSA